MLDATMTQQLKTYLANLREPVELVASLGDDDKSAQTRELLEEIAALHDLVSAQLRRHRQPQAQLRDPPRQRCGKVGPLCRTADGA